MARPSTSTLVPERTLFDRPRTKVGGALVVAVLVLAACSDSTGPEPPERGDAFSAGSGSISPLTIPPGQEVIVLVRAVANSSDEPLEITKLRAIPGDGVPEAVQIVQVSVVTDDSHVAPGTYVTSPPVARESGRCIRAVVRAPRGLTLDTGDEPMLLIWLRSLAEGVATIDGLRVAYAQSGTTYEQEYVLEDLAEVTVDPAAAPLKPSRAEQACVAETRVLPGAVTY